MQHWPLLLHHHQRQRQRHHLRFIFVDMKDQGVFFEFSFSENSVKCEIVTAAVECKNWNSLIKTDELLKILKKQINKSTAKFCKSFVGSTTKTSSFARFCTRSKINVYRIKRKLNFKIWPFELIIFQFS